VLVRVRRNLFKSVVAWRCPAALNDHIRRTAHSSRPSSLHAVILLGADPSCATCPSPFANYGGSNSRLCCRVSNRSISDHELGFNARAGPLQLRASWRWLVPEWLGQAYQNPGDVSVSDQRGQVASIHSPPNLSLASPPILQHGGAFFVCGCIAAWRFCLRADAFRQLRHSYYCEQGYLPRRLQPEVRGFACSM
jgi:hypothetical protein